MNVRRWAAGMGVVVAIAPLVAGWTERAGRWGSLPEGPQTVVQSGQPARGTEFLPDELAAGRLVVLAGFGADPAADPSSWVMTDITSQVMASPPITIVPGRQDEQQQTQPVSVTFTVKNSGAYAGWWSTRRPQSPYYPNVKTGLPIEILVDAGWGEQDRATVFVDTMTRTYDETGNYAVVEIHATGVMNRLSQHAQAIRSALRTAYLASSPAQYWSLEDPQDPTNPGQVASNLTDGTALDVTGVPLITWQGEDGPPGGGKAMDFSTSATANTTLVAKFPAQSGTSHWEVDFSMRYATTDTSYQVTMSGWGDTSRTFWYMDTNPAGSGGLTVHTLRAGTIATHSSGTAVGTDSRWHLYRILGSDDGAGNTAVSVYVDQSLIFSFTATGIPFGAVNEIDAQAALVSTDAVQTGLGHVAVYQSWPGGTGPSDAIYQAFTGHDGEGCWTRFLRLCSENGIPAAIATGATSGGRAMGPQSVDTLPNLLRECETVDGGLIIDG